MSENSGPAALRSRADSVKEKAAGAMSAQQQKAAGQLRTVAGGLHEAAAKHIEPGAKADMARQAADRMTATASWLDERTPGDLMVEIRALARSRPGVFAAGAAVAGLAVGRMTRRNHRGPGGRRGRGWWQS